MTRARREAAASAAAPPSAPPQTSNGTARTSATVAASHGVRVVVVPAPGVIDTVSAARSAAAFQGAPLPCEGEVVEQVDTSLAVTFAPADDARLEPGHTGE